MKIYESFSELVGNTPLFSPKYMCESEGITARLLLKLEYFNPAGSVKDRVAVHMLDDAERRGLIARGSVIVEPTSGNTGIGLAAAAAARGYRVILTMPDSMSMERRMLLAAYGAEIVLTPATEGMSGAVREAQRIADTTPGAYIPSQFDNPSNPESHILSTGPEILRDAGGRIDAFVASAGTGGTLSGCARYIKSKNPDAVVVAVEPADSPLLSEGRSGPHKIQGIGANFVPAVLDRSLIDRIMTVTTDEAFSAARLLAKSEGILTGISSGAALFAAMKLAREDDFCDKTIVALLPDTGERYLSSGLFDT